MNLGGSVSKELMSILLDSDLPSTNPKLFKELYVELETYDFQNTEESLKHFQNKTIFHKFCTERLKDDKGLVTITSSTRRQTKQEFAETHVCALLKATADKAGDACVAKVNLDLDYYNAKRLAKEVFNNSHLRKPVFPITKHDVIIGKAVRTFGNKQNITFLIKYVWVKQTDAGDVFVEKYAFIDDVKPRVTGELMDTISAAGDYFVYSFITDDNQSYVLLSDELISSSGKVCVKGMVVPVNRKLDLDNGTKLPSNTRILVAHTITDLARPFSLSEAGDFLKSFGLAEFLTYLLGKYRHPEYFENLVLAWLLSGEYQGYPLHLFWVARNGSGKSFFIKNVYKAMGETAPLPDGSRSRLKGVLPSYAKMNSPRPGAFLLFNRVAFVDEFLRLLASMGKDEKSTALGQFNSLLEHQKEFSGMSAHGNIDSTSTAKALFTTNPLYTGRDLAGLLDTYSDDSFWARVIVYFQSLPHLKFVDDRKLSVELEPDVVSGIKRDDWLRFYDFSYTHVVKIDGVVGARLKELFNKYLLMVPSCFRDAFKGRMMHHVMCLLDGAVKIRCLRERAWDLVPRDGDFELLDELLSEIISSWDIDAQYVLKLNPKARLKYLSDAGKRAYFLLDHDCLGKATLNELRELGLANPAVLSELLQRKMIVLKDGNYYTYWRSEVKTNGVS